MESNADVRLDHAQGDASKRGKSEVDFPYLDLENSCELARAIHEVGGTSCQLIQLAAYLKQEAKGGGFRLRMNTAKSFSLVEYDRGHISLTELGRKLVDPQQERPAKVDAFLSVELYKLIYEKFKGGTLPPQAGLERTMAQLGVSEKVVGRARQAFQRSAKQAGFFDMGADRLVPPAFRNSVQPASQVNGVSDAPVPSPQGGGGTGGDGTGGSGLHPFIEGLLKTLPTPETNWPITGRVKWLQAASHLFDLIYTNEDPSDPQGVSYIEITKKAI